jgi:hypothetical protein
MRIVGDVEEFSGSRVEPQAQFAVSDFPSAAILLLVFVKCRIASARLSLHVVPPHIFGAGAAGPKVLARKTTGMATDAFIEMEHHRNL